MAVSCEEITIFFEEMGMERGEMTIISMERDVF